MITTLPHAVTIIVPGYKQNRYGDTVADWDAGTKQQVPGWVQQRSTTTQVGQNRAAIVTTWMLMVNPDAYVPAGAQIKHGVRTFRVVGEPRQLTTPTGVHHIEAQLETVDG